MSFECDICGKVLDKEQNFKSHIESVHEGRNLMNVTFVVKY